MMGGFGLRIRPLMISCSEFSQVGNWLPKIENRPARRRSVIWVTYRSTERYFHSAYSDLQPMLRRVVEYPDTVSGWNYVSSTVASITNVGFIVFFADLSGLCLYCEEDLITISWCK